MIDGIKTGDEYPGGTAQGIDAIEQRHPTLGVLHRRIDQRQQGAAHKEARHPDERDGERQLHQ